jgi:hypothetical protein
MAATANNTNNANFTDTPPTETHVVRDRRFQTFWGRRKK